MSELHCISADSHVVEPPNTWVDNIDPEYRDRAPRVHKENGNDIFTCENIELLGVAGTSAAGRQQLGKYHGTYEDDVPRGAYEPGPRLEEMAVDGVDAEVLYPSIALPMYAIEDLGFKQAVFRGYNTWLAGYSRAHPDRLKGVALIALDELAEATKELRRARDMGLAGAAIAVYGGEDADVQYGGNGLDPFWGAAEELGMPVSLHIITDKAGQTMKNLLHARSPLYNVAARATEPTFVQETLSYMIFGGVFERFPGLKVISAENDAGWAGYYIERLNYLWQRRRNSADFGIKGDMLPGDYFRRNVYLTFMRDRSAIVVRDLVGVDHLMWSSDYPHTDSTWPNSQKVIDYLFEGDVSEADRHRIIAANAVEVYGF